MKGYVYLITNIHNGSQYVGKTYLSIQDRWRTHLRNAFCIRNIDTKFYRAIREFGKDSFVIESLGEFEKGTLEQKEIEYIRKYDSCRNGYNSTYGGEGYYLTKIDEAEVIELHDCGYSLRHIAAEIGVGSTRKISKIVKRHGRDAKRQTACNVEQFSLDGELLNTFESKKQAWKWLVENYKFDIKACTAYHYIKKASETQGIAFGYRWKQLDTDTVPISNVNPNKVEIRCNGYDNTGNIVFDNERLVDIAKYLVDNNMTLTSDWKTVSTTIVQSNNGKIYGYTWEVFRVNKQ